MRKQVIKKLAAGLLIVLAVSVAPAVRAQDARALVMEAAGTYRNLSQYRLEATMQITMEAAGNRQSADLYVLQAGRPGGAMRTQVKGENMEMTIISSGDTTWLYLPTLNQYLERPGPFDPSTAGAALPDLAQQFGAIGDSILSAVQVGEERVQVGGTAHTARVVDVVYQPRPSPAGADSSRRRLWIDPERRLVVREQMHGYLAESPMGGPMTIDETTTFSALQIGEALPDSLFAFTPPAGATVINPDDMAGGGSGMEGSDAMNFELKDLAGHSVDLASRRGQVVLVNFWATWCGPCNAEMPLIEALHREYEKQGLAVLAVNVAEDAADVQAYVKERGYTFPVLLDPDGAVSNQYGANGIPMTVLVGRDGKVVAQFFGARSEEAFRSALQQAGLK